MIALLLFAVAAALNAVMDLLENENFHASVFKNLNQAFWYKRESWKTARRIFGYKLDAWHLTKSTMVVVLALAAIAYRPILTPAVDIFLFGAAWIGPFNFTYKKLKR